MSSFDDDMKEMRRQVTAEVIYTINSSPSLFAQFSGQSGAEVKESVFNYSKENDNEFGPVFEAELEALNRNDWKRVSEAIK